jgi:hypothetical protein
MQVEKLVDKILLVIVASAIVVGADIDVGELARNEVDDLISDASLIVSAAQRFVEDERET